MQRMPVLFAGHGSPMNAIEENPFTKTWRELAPRLGKPKAILSVSAHWFVSGVRVSDAEAQRTIHDMYGFPETLYQVRYDAPGAPDVARRALALLGPAARPDRTWGLDHGTWSVLRHLYPAADVPVFQVSVDADATPARHFALGQTLAPLRDEGVLIFASGNVVHNLGLVRWGAEGGMDWAEEFDGCIRRNVEARAFEKAVAFREAGPSARLAVPTPDHFAPLLTALGAADADADEITVFNAACVYGSLSMTGYLFSGRAELGKE